MGEPVGFVGLGIMGSRMAACLARAGPRGRGLQPQPAEKAEAWVAEHGGRVAESPREAAEGAAVVITMVVDGPQVEQVLLGEDGAAARGRSRHADRSTCRRSRRPTPAGSARRSRSAGWRSSTRPCRAPSPKAEDGTLTIMAGGSEADVARARPYFDAMGEVILHVGELGQGQTVKVISNAVGATNCATLAQALVVGKATGVDLASLVSVLGVERGRLRHGHDEGGAACSSTTTRRCSGSSTCSRTCRSASRRARRPALRSRRPRSARELYAAAMGRGLGDQDFAAVLEAAEGLAGIRI